MKNLLVLVSLLAVMASGVAVAQNQAGGTSAPQTQAKKKKKAKKTARKAAPNVKPATPVAQQAAPTTPEPATPKTYVPPYVAPPSAIGVAQAAPQATTKMPIAEAKPESKKGKFSFKYRSLNSYDLATMENAVGADKQDKEVQAWDRFNFTYNITDGVSFSVMPQVFHTWFGNRNRPQDNSIEGLNQPYSGYMGNTGLILSDSKITTLQGGLDVEGFARYDIPTSEMSQKADSLGEGWMGLGIGRSFGIVDIKWDEWYRYYFQQYTTATVTKSGKQVQNNEWALYSLLELGVNITKKLNVSLMTGFLNIRKLADANTGRPAGQVDELIMNPEIAYAFNDSFSLAGGLWEEPDMRSLPSSGYSPFSPDNGATAYVMPTIKF